jgi:hypothetical protein
VGPLIVAGESGAGYIKVTGEVPGYLAIITLDPPLTLDIVPAKGCAGKGVFSAGLGDSFVPEGIDYFPGMVAAVVASGHMVHLSFVAVLY